jgi:putative ABC transport system permease protein
LPRTRAASLNRSKSLWRGTSIWHDKNGNNTWDVTIDGIYAAGNGNDQGLFLHYKYWNESSAFRHNTTTLYVLRIAEGANAAAVANRVDALFANSPHATRTSTEKALVQNYAAQLGDISAIVTAIVGAVFFGMLLVTANAMARAVRERASELAVMKVLGFTRGAILALIAGESVMLTIFGGLAGIGFIALLGLLSAALPCVQVLRMNVASALRKKA